jgi:predicted outer membrane protein
MTNARDLTADPSFPTLVAEINEMTDSALFAKGLLFARVALTMYEALQLQQINLQLASTSDDPQLVSVAKPAVAKLVASIIEHAGHSVSKSDAEEAYKFAKQMEAKHLWLIKKVQGAQ